MPYAPLKRFVYRAPLLPVRALRDAAGPARRLAAHPLGSTALRLASADLSEALASGRGDARARAAIGRYARRAAFRPTPNGFWAGVGVGTLAARTRVRTGGARGHLSPSWQSLAALGRGLLDDPDIRPRARLRRAPSLVVGARALLWLASGGPDASQDDFCQERYAERDDALAALISACAAWTPWETVRAAVATTLNGGVDSADSTDDLDDWLLTLIDDGLLHADVVPPLIGRDPCAWMEDRLVEIPEAHALAEDFIQFRATAARGDAAGAAAALVAMSGGESERVRAPRTGTPLRGTLVFSPSSEIRVSKAAVERATALAPLLFRLQEALVPPSAERTPGPGLSQALEAATEIFGAGALDVGALALGGYGACPGDDDDTLPVSPTTPPPPPLLTFLLDAVMQAVGAGQTEVHLRSHDLDPLLAPTALPPTAELFLTPTRTQPGGRSGDGWLLGLHAPAGASWGRFAIALGDQARPLFEDLRDAEAHARPEERTLDVVFTPNARLADLCVHPPLRPDALALSGWPDEAAPDATNPHPVTLADLELVADPAALEPLALRASDLGPVTPAALHRVRSTTAPAGLWQTLVGWSLRRQHAPWALSWGPLAQLAFLPRVSIDGFVVTPASWRIPDELRDGTGSARALATWQREGRVPRHVQVGVEDELLPVDLTAADARDDLKEQPRAFEIWPPLDDTPDESGRRIEVVVGIVDVPDDDERDFHTAAAAATAAAGRVPPPMSDAVLDDAWRTFKLFGATDRQDLVLAEIIGPAIAAALDDGEISGWFFQRYVEGPGRRPHLRLRVARANDDASFERRLASIFASRSAPGDIVALDTAPYFPEVARFGGPATLPAVHKLFEASSDLVLAQLDRE
ncbi:MAG TPA: thiopeptide-type bacteriocin biosynthesis protein, partial [Polyangia bacterium]|nr:thiopeptide-type bacteriocin biosynthesis protein [Polyangia bacterium]